MRRLIISSAIVLTFAASLSGYQQSGQKTIKDPLEYNAYITASNMQDPAQKAAAMEAFTNQYPNSVVKIDALEQAMAAYQASGNLVRVEQTANRILEADNNHIRALAIVCFIKRNKATGGDASALSETRTLAERGMQALPGWTKPSMEMSDADFEKLKNQMTAIFNGAAGFAALQGKDYTHARDYYLKSVAIDPNNLQDVYQLSIAYLEMKPVDATGFWYIARAINLSKGNQAAQQSIATYGKAKYKRYHASDEGWDKVIASAAEHQDMPSGFSDSIKRAPTPAEIAVQAIQENDPAQLSFSDWEYVLSFRDASPANKQAADRVWQEIQEKEKNGQAKLAMDVKVISATTTTIEAAITEDNQQANRADIHIILEKELASPPAAGATIKVIGVLTSYMRNPFMFKMEQVEVAVH